MVVAGWTTANPTIYRAGLAFQAIVAAASRFKVTLIAGRIATLAGMFPAIAMKLLDFVALYGLMLMPMGAVIFVDFWLCGRLGFRAELRRAERHELQLGRGAGVAGNRWPCAWRLSAGTLQIYFVGLPGWFMAAPSTW